MHNLKHVEVFRVVIWIDEVVFWGQVDDHSNRTRVRKHNYKYN